MDGSTDGQTHHTDSHSCFLFPHLHRGIYSPEVNSLKDFAVEARSLLRLKGESHLDERVRQTLAKRNKFEVLDNRLRSTRYIDTT